MAESFHAAGAVAWDPVVWIRRGCPQGVLRGVGGVAGFLGMVSRWGRLVVLAVVLVLVGCVPSEGEDPMSAPATSGVPVTSGGPGGGGSVEPGADVSEAPEVEAPERPAAMAEESVEGAIAAAKYFLDLYPYIYATGDLTEWDALSDDGCGFCANVSEQVVELYRDGGYAIGVDTEIYAEHGGGPYSEGVYIVDLGLRFRESTFVDGDGGRTQFDAEDRPEFSISIGWRQDGWTILGVDAGAAS